MQTLFDTVTAWLDARIDDRIAASAKPEAPELTEAQITDITDAVLRRIELTDALEDTIEDTVKQVLLNRVSVSIDVY